MAEKLARACAGVIDAENSACASKHIEALRSALKPTTLSMFNGAFEPNRYQDLVHELDEIASDQGFGEFAQTCSRTATRCFCELELEPSPSPAQLEHTFAKKLIKDIVLNFFFARTRDGIAFNTGRQEREQLDWERHILDCLDPLVEKFAQGLRTGRKTQLTPGKEFSSSGRIFDHQQRLHEPLRILGV